MPLRNQIKKAITQAEGSVFYVKKTITSSNITNTLADLTGVADNGDVVIEEVILATDSTGLATGTNFQITVNGETYGINAPIVEAVSNLGASAVRVAPSPSPAADTTNDNGITITAALPLLLEAGDKLQYNCTGSDCTGSGKVTVLLKCRRLSQGAKLKAA